MITPGKRCKSGKGRFLLAHALAFCLALNLLGHAVPRAAHAGSWTQVQYWSNEDLVDVAAGPGNTVYVATLQGVRKWAAGSWINLGKPQYLSGILVTPAGELWARGNYIYWGYVYRWAGGTSWSCVLSSDSLNIYDIDVDPSGKVWLGCSDGRLRYWNGSSFLSTAQWPHGSSPIQRIAFAADGTLWAGGQSGRVARWTGSAWTDAGQLPSAYSDTVAMAVDNKGQPVVVGAGWSDDSWYSVSYRRADGSWVDAGVGANFQGYLSHLTPAPDGSFFVAQFYDRVYRYPGGLIGPNTSGGSGTFYYPGPAKVVVASDGSLWPNFRTSNLRTQ